jgi:hypothetical protein
MLIIYFYEYQNNNFDFEIYHIHAITLPAKQKQQIVVKITHKASIRFNLYYPLKLYMIVCFYEIAFLFYSWSKIVLFNAF